MAKKGVERFCGWRVSKGEDSLDSRQTTTAIRLDARHVHPQSTSSATNASRLCDYSPQYSSKVSSGFRTIHTHLPSYHPRHPHTYLTHSENRGFSLVAYTLTPHQLHSSIHFERTPCIGAVNLAMARTTRSSAAQQEKPSDDSERQSSTSSPPSNRKQLIKKRKRLSDVDHQDQPVAKLPRAEEEESETKNQPSSSPNPPFAGDLHLPQSDANKILDILEM